MVTQQNAATQRGTARAGRWLARALLVVGGAIAGTAAAWAISAATADAATLAPEPAPATDSITPVTDAAVAATDDITWGASNFVGDTAAAAVRAGTADNARDHQVGGDVSDAVHDFTQTAVLRPAIRILGAVEHSTRKPQDAPRVIGEALTPSPEFRQAVLGFLHPAGGDLIKLPALPGTIIGDQHTPGTAPASEGTPAPAAIQAGPMGPVAMVLTTTRQADALHAGSHGDRAGHQHGEQPGKFPFSPVRGPLAPSGVPVVPGGAPSNSGHLDGPLLGVPAAAMTVADSDGLRALRFGIRHTPVQPGSQPGVTPD